MLPRPARSTVIFYVSALNGTGHTSNELLLHQEEDGSSGDGGQNNSTHHHAVVGSVGRTHGRQNQRQGTPAAGLQCNQRPQIAVPNVHEGNNDGSSIGGLHGGDVDLQEDPDLAQTVDTGGLDQILGEGCGVLLKEENQEGGGNAGDDDSTGRVQTDEAQAQLVEVTEQLEQRHHQGCEGNHHGCEDKIKDSLLRRDSTLNSVASAMKQVMMQGVKMEDGSQLYLSEFGIGTLGYFSAKDNEKNAYHIDGDPDDASTMTNADKLKSAIANDPDKVVEFFSTLSKNLYEKLGSLMKKTEYSSSFTLYDDIAMKNEYNDYTSKISKQEQRIADYEDRYYKKFSAMETALAKLQSKESAIGGLFNM